MKRGPFQIKLAVDPKAPLVFDIETHPGELVTAWGHVEKGSVIAKEQTAKLVPVLVFDVDYDMPKIMKRVVLVPYSGWLGEADAMRIGFFMNPLDRSPCLIYEVPYVEAPVVEHTSNDLPAIAGELIEPTKPANTNEETAP